MDKEHRTILKPLRFFTRDSRIRTKEYGLRKANSIFFSELEDLGCTASDKMPHQQEQETILGCRDRRLWTHFF
jgi:hypothetical protein